MKLALLLIAALPGFASSAVFVSRSFTPAPPALSLLIRDAIVSARTGGVELRGAMPAGMLRSLQAIDSLDLKQESHRAVLGAMTQHLPADFDARLTAYFANPESGQAQQIANIMAAAYEQGAASVDAHAAPIVQRMLKLAADGKSNAGVFENLARELDRYDIYGPRVWALSGHVRATILAYKSPKTIATAEEMAQKLLARHFPQEAPAAAAADTTATAASGLDPGAPQEAPPATVDQILDIIGASLKNDNRINTVNEPGKWVDFNALTSDGRQWYTASRVYVTPASSGKFEIAARQNFVSKIRTALAASGLILESPFKQEGEYGYHYIEPRYVVKDEAGWRAAELNGMFKFENDPALLKKKIEALGSPAARAAGLAELDKFQAAQAADAEKTRSREYLSWLLKAPWARHTKDRLDLVKAKELLNKRQFGLQRVKDRILEFLAVRKRKGDLKGAILCFNGPPGVGKTAIAQSIAEALGRRFVRLSLGGVYDATELRGHNRTYVGAQPGSIIRQLVAAGTNNPVMLLDEIDKIGKSGMHGSPEAALLEILDPAQNDTFRDHYLDLPVDLSGVLFIATANELDKISKPLLDRMELIEFPSYTPIEKLEIAERHLVPASREAAGLKPEEGAITKSAIARIIEGYTLESGVRLLRQKLDELYRKVVALVETGRKPAPATIADRDVEGFLGPPRYGLQRGIDNGVGVATGLAVNAYGGTTINLEVVTNNGTGKIALRHQFKDMASDSAHNAVAYIRTVAHRIGIPDQTFGGVDIDIAFTPAMEVDGPSAGIAMATAIASRLSGRAVRKGVAMTGELTLSGRVMPIGGLSEKIMAAYRAGIYSVIYPAANQRDIETIPAEIRAQIKLIPVGTAEEVFHHALESAAPERSAGDQAARLAKN